MPAMPAARPPSIDAILRAADGALEGRDRAAVVAQAREVAAAERARLAAGTSPAFAGELARELELRLLALGSPVGGASSPVAEGATPGRGEAALRPAINATGVILHTNLGRAAWPAAAIEAAMRAAAAPSLLELDEGTGRRGRRFRAVEEQVIALTGAEDALVTNNNAAAVALAVGLAGRGGVAVSRGELVEIGGGVRIPEIVRRAGARLVEVGTTNRTRVADFEEALADGRAKLVLRVHPSNFVQTGFVESPDPAELATAAHRYGAIVVDDLGSGALLDTARFGLAHEPMPGERLAAGSDLVTFSGDKLVGGPQAGMIAGRRDLVARLRKDPLARAMRPDKVVLASVAATLRLYRAGVAHTEIPIWRQIGAPLDALNRRASAVFTALAEEAPPRAEHEPRVSLEVDRTESTVGGGSLPGQTLPSWAVCIGGVPPQRLLDALRAATPAVIGRVVDDEVVLDLRTVDPSEDDLLRGGIVAALTSIGAWPTAIRRRA
jgi:L-seryl-tRNA(Ser) seleniumtransferase